MTTPAELVAFLSRLTVAQLTSVTEAIAMLIKQKIEDPLLASIVADNRQNPVTGGLPPAQRVTVSGAPLVTNGAPLDRGGWYEPKPVDEWRPPGQAIFDQLMDAEDAKDRAARQRQ
jgi:hypothetical protein